MIPHQEIQARAHTIWEQCGRPAGCELEHWLRAERELQTEQQQAREFRAGLAAPDALRTAPQRRRRSRA